MKKKYRLLATFVAITGLIIGWNLQNKQTVEALLGSNSFVTRSTSGGDPNGASLTPSISNDGRYVVFMTNASNLVTNDTNGYNDIYLKDTVTGTYTIVSVDSSGNQANNHSDVGPVISGDGEYVIYSSNATNLVTGDTNGQIDIFRYTVATGVTERVSVDSSGNEANGWSRYPDVDTEGRFVVFATSATNLSPLTDTNSTNDILMRDMSTGTVTHISQSDSGVLGNGTSFMPKISCSGRFIVFYSNASNLTSDTNNGWTDVFLTDMLGTQTVTNITKSGNQMSYYPDISCDGNYIAFMSRASNLGVNPTSGVTYDVYRYDRLTSAIEAVSTREDGTTATDESYTPESNSFISSDGRYVIFYSPYSSFVTSTSDTNNGHDLFLRDMESTGFRIISQTPTGATGNYQNQGLDSSGVALSGTNRIVFSSKSTDLVSGASDWTQADIFMVDVGTPNTCAF